MPTPEELANVFTYHAPTAPDMLAYQRVRSEAHMFSLVLNELVPHDGPELDAAIAALRSCVMWANAGIACRQRTAVSIYDAVAHADAAEGTPPATVSVPAITKPSESTETHHHSRSTDNA